MLFLEYCNCFTYKNNSIEICIGFYDIDDIRHNELGISCAFHTKSIVETLPHFGLYYNFFTHVIS